MRRRLLCWSALSSLWSVEWANFRWGLLTLTSPELVERVELEQAVGMLGYAEEVRP
jgi:hypothetical protein